MFNLSPTQLQNDLSQLAGQNAAGAQTSGFTLMTEFVDLMLGQSGGGGGGGGGLGFAPDQQMAALPPEIALAYDTILKAPPRASFDQRWSVWGSGFGGTATFNGNAAVGSNTAHRLDPWLRGRYGVSCRSEHVGSTSQRHGQPAAA